MTTEIQSPMTVKDEWLGARAAGTLSDAQQLLLDCQTAIRPAVRSNFAAGDAVAGTMLETATGVDLSDDFSRRLTAQLTQNEKTAQVNSIPTTTTKPAWVPAPLAEYMERNDIQLKWRPAGPGVHRAHLSRGPSGERLYLLRARAGFSVPTHGHTGEEWTLLLTGGYHVGKQGFVAGDLHQEDETCTHAVNIDDDGPCISLVADEGILKFSNPILRLLQPFFGV